MRHRGVEFEVEEASPSKWRWKIYQKIEFGPNILGDPDYPSREAAIGGCIRRINRDIDRDTDAPRP